MKRTLALGIAALMLASVAGGIGYWYAMRAMPSMSATASNSSTAAAAKPEQKTGERKVLYWHDPMVPGQRFDKPGKSPFMDMPLVPVYADEESASGTVSISPRVVQNLGVRTAEVVKGVLARKLESVGSVAYNERNVAIVQARVSGYVEKLYALAPLDRVRKGQPLVQLLAPEWVAAQEEYLAVKRMQLPDGAALLAAARQRLLLAGMSEAQVRSFERSGEVAARITLRAPVSGVIVELGAREGMTLQPGATLFRINDLSSVWVNAEVPEAHAAAVRLGGAVRARTTAYPDTEFEGRVNAILPEVSTATRTLKVRIELANPGGKLAPGMFASVDFAAAEQRDSLIVPSEAVIQTGTRSVVLIAEGQGKFQPVDVQVGMESAGQTEIRKGLQAGQEVVVSGQFLIDSEASLKGATTRMQSIPATDAKASASAPPSNTHRAEGTLELIGRQAVTISHGPVSSLNWGAMTMDFQVPPQGLPQNIAVGDRIRFEFRAAEKGGFELQSIAPLQPAPTARAAEAKKP